MYQLLLVVLAGVQFRVQGIGLSHSASGSPGDGHRQTRAPVNGGGECGGHGRLGRLFLALLLILAGGGATPDALDCAVGDVSHVGHQKLEYGPYPLLVVCHLNSCLPTLLPPKFPYLPMYALKIGSQYLHLLLRLPGLVFPTPYYF